MFVPHLDSIDKCILCILAIASRKLVLSFFLSPRSPFLFNGIRVSSKSGTKFFFVVVRDRSCVLSTIR